MSKKINIQKIMFFIMVMIGACIVMYPLLWMLSSSFKPNYYIFKEMGLWPKRFTLENYQIGWQGVGAISFGNNFKNSFIIVIFVVLGNLMSCSLAAYAFARLQFSFKKIFFAMMLGTVMLPVHVTLIPRYIIFDSLGWINSFLPLIVPSFLATQSFFIFLMVQFMRGLPPELDDAAIVDGCGPFQIYLRVILPLSLPALVTTALFTFIWTWNDFLSQLIYLSKPKMYTVALGLRAFNDATGESAFGQLFAMSILSLIPIFILFVFFQRLLIEGISTTGLKG